MRLYRWLLRLCPEAIRREYGAAMEETFARRLAEARTLGTWRRANLWRRELAGLVALAVTERWGAATRERRRRQRGNRGRRAGRMDGMAQELRQAARRLARTPTFTLAAALTLALAIGANASIFAVVQRVVLNPLPYPDSDQVVALDHGRPQNASRSSSMPPGLYFHYVDRARTLMAAALYRLGELTITSDGAPERISVVYATPSLASVLQVQPARGRWFTEAEAAPGAPQVALLSYGLWQRRYAGTPDIVGESLTVGGVPTEIVGIMPPSFSFPNSAFGFDAWIADQVSRSAGFGIFSHNGVARLRDGATVDEARAELTRLIADLPQAYPAVPLALTLANTVKLISRAVTLKEATVGNIAPALWILLASAGLVLLVACANVANLFLVRSEARQREVAVRRALGAGRLGIARHFLTESALLSALGGLLGLALASTAVRVLVSVGPPNLPRLNEIRLDPIVVTFTCALSMAAALVFGAIPLLRGAPIAAMLHESGRGNTASRGRHRVRHVLMGGQIALALVLLVSSGLMVRSFQNLLAVDPGFDSASALTFRLGLPDAEYPSRDAAAAAHQTILERLAEIPGVAAVSASTCLPLAGGCMGNTLRVEGRVDPEGTIPPIVSFRAVASGYVEAMRMRLLRGRSVDRGDVERREPIVLVNAALADAYFPNQDPIGQHVSFGRAPNWFTIVGIVSNTTTTALNEATPVPKMYMPMSIAGGPGIPVADLVGPNVSVMNYVVRSATPPLGLVASARRAVDTVDANLAMANVTTLEDILERASAQMAFTMVLLAIAALVSLVLGVVGIYGVMSYVVTQRTGEIGMRLALGAAPGTVASQIVRQGGLVALVGIAVGLASAFAGSRFIGALLFETSPRDPGVFAVTTLLLFGVALLACWLPARRAARLSPLEALRSE